MPVRDHRYKAVAKTKAKPDAKIFGGSPAWGFNSEADACAAVEGKCSTGTYVKVQRICGKSVSWIACGLVPSS